MSFAVVKWDREITAGCGIAWRWAAGARRQVGGDLYGYYALAEGTLLANCIDSDRESITTKMVYKGCGAHDLRIGATKQGAAA